MQQQITTGTQSANVTHDLTRLDEEYLVQIGHWYWIVFLTEEARQALSDRLTQMAVKGLFRRDECDPEPTWAITGIGYIRKRREPFSIDEYLAELGNEGA